MGLHFDTKRHAIGGRNILCANDGVYVVVHQMRAMSSPLNDNVHNFNAMFGEHNVYWKVSAKVVQVERAKPRQMKLPCVKIKATK